MKRQVLMILPVLAVLLSAGSCISPRYIIGTDLPEAGGRSDAIVIFEDGLPSGGYTYAYPDKSRIMVSEDERRTGEAGLDVTLDEKNYSGAALGFGVQDLSGIRSSGSLEFYVKGASGKESFFISLIDSEDDGIKVSTTVGADAFVKTTKDWQKVLIPLYKFGDAGKWWDGAQEQSAAFDWKRVSELRISSLPQGNPIRLFLDDILINRDAGFQRKVLQEVELIVRDEQNEGCSLGVFGEGFQGDTAGLRMLEKTIGRKFAMVMWYIDWKMPFPADNCRYLTGQGYVPHIVWEPWFFDDKNRIKLDNILNGEWDGYIRKWAEDAAEWGGTVFIRWGHEFNGDWYPWSLAQNGRDPQKYIRAYRYVHGFFTRAKATNVKWLWSPNNNSVPQEDWNDPLKSYPGDAYVDWLAPDGYNFGLAGGSGKWMGFNDVFQSIYLRLVENYNKPIILGEYASGPEGGIKHKWVENMGEELEKNYPAVKALVWFHINKETDWRMDDEPETVEAFRKIFRRPHFLSEYDNLVSQQARFAKNWPEYKRRAAAIRERYQQKPVAVAKRMAVPPSLRGDAAEWSGVSPITLDKGKDLMATGAFWGGPDDSRAEVRFAWDESYFYVLADVTDDVPMVNPNRNADIWNGDNLEIAISTDPQADPKRPVFGPSDFQIGVTPGDLETGLPPQVWCWTLGRSPEGSRAYSRRTENGYLLEAAIPWKELKGFSPREGMVLGFSFALDDGDEDKKRSAQSIWFGDDSFYRNPSVWGSIKLVK